MHIEKGGSERFLLTESRELVAAKDRSGRLSSIEAPNLGDIATKIRGVKNEVDTSRRTGSSAKVTATTARGGGAQKPNVPLSSNAVVGANSPQ